MKRQIVLIRAFAKAIDDLIEKRKLLKEDFDLFKRKLVEYPEEGDLIPGTGGIRKIRLKSASKGKSGGFRICYFDYPEDNELFLILIYQKNEKEDLSAGEKKTLKELTDTVKKRRK